MKKFIYIFCFFVIFVTSCKEDEVIYVTTKAVLYDTITVNSVNTSTILSYDTVRTIVYDTMRNFIDEKITTYDTIRTYTSDTVIITNYDTVRTYTYDTIMITSYDTIRSYQTVTINVYDTISVTINPDGTLSNSSWIIYITNTATKEIDSVNVKNGETITLKSDLYRLGYDFVGWNTQSNGKGIMYGANENIIVTKHLTLYAIWQSREGLKVSELYDYLVHNSTETMNIKIIDQNPDIYGIVSAFEKFKNIVNIVNLDISDAILLTELEDNSFKNCQILSSVMLPSTLQKINNAFDGCCNLKSVNIPNGVKEVYFNNCAIRNINIPESVQILNISNCNNLQHINFSENSQLYNFKGCINCKSLLSIDIPNSVRYLGSFAGCSSLKQVLIPSNVKEMELCFKDCSNLSYITIPEGITTINKSSFSGCSNLISITIPKSVTNIEAEAFYDCRSLSELEIPENVNSIGEYAFFHCTNMSKLIFRSLIPPKISNILSYDYDKIHGYTCNTRIYVPSEKITIYKQAEVWSTYADRIGIYEYQ